MGKRRVLFASAAMVVAAIGAGGIATAHGTRQHFNVTLRGAEEAPTAADPDGRATAKLDIDPQAGKICWDLRYRDIGTPTLAHIHKAPRGVSGPVVVPFFDGTPAHPLPDLDVLERGRVSGCTTNVDPALATDIGMNPSSYYVNIHDARFAAGALRGQIR